MVKVWAALGDGGITEDPGLKSDIRGERLHGYCEGRHIWVNPTWSVIDTVIHELLHRMYPGWSEEYVRNRTSYLVNRMTDEEAGAFYEEYVKRAKRRRKRERSGADHGRRLQGRGLSVPGDRGDVLEVRRGTDDSGSD